MDLIRNKRTKYGNKKTPSIIEEVSLKYFIPN